jgi:hypothetical protein
VLPFLSVNVWCIVINYQIFSETGSGERKSEVKQNTAKVFRIFGFKEKALNCQETIPKKDSIFHVKACTLLRPSQNMAILENYLEEKLKLYNVTTYEYHVIS